MKVTIIADPGAEQEEPEILIRCGRITPEIRLLEKQILTLGRRITGCDGPRSRSLNPQDIFYFEAVDGKTFAYLTDQVWQVQESLDTLEELLGNHSGTFIRASKACLMNLRHVEHLTSAIGSRIIASMENGEDILVSRHYARLLRAYLKTEGGISHEKKI